MRKGRKQIPGGLKPEHHPAVWALYEQGENVGTRWTLGGPPGSRVSQATQSIPPAWDMPVSWGIQENPIRSISASFRHLQNDFNLYMEKLAGGDLLGLCKGAPRDPPRVGPACRINSWERWCCRSQCGTGDTEQLLWQRHYLPQ